MKTNKASPLTAQTAGTEPVCNESSLRSAIVTTCRTLHDEQLDALGLLSLSHRAHRSAASGMLTLGSPGGQCTGADALQWHALEPESLGWATASADTASAQQNVGKDSPTEPSPLPDENGPTDPWLALHRSLLRELAQVHCVLLLAPVHATALACMAAIQRDGLPPFHPALATFGADDLACADGLPAATATGGAGNDDIGAATESILAALGGRHACLLANLGMLVTGQSLPQAAERARRLEALARTYCTALQIGEPALLEAGRMHDIRHHWQVPR